MNSFKKLDEKFYQQTDVVAIARKLLGKVLVTNIDGILTSGMIVETEAYSWRERGCHAYLKRKTQRNETMFEAGGCSYIYLCYGVYELFNVVTNKKDIPDAVLIRAIEPIEGIELMMERARKKSLHKITSGPGKLSIAMGITRKLNAVSLSGERLWLEDRAIKIKSSDIVSSSRIGMNFNGEDAHLPWRFTIRGNTWVSK